MQWRRAPTVRPYDLGWAIAWSFVVGATLFAIGSFPAYGQLVDPGVVGTTFVVGSVFFTAAAYGQFVQVASAGEPRRRLVGWRPGERAWWATVVQLVGTVMFNINTIAATIDGLTTEESNRLVWAPDMIGSAAFLIASHLAWLEVCGRPWCLRRDDAGWWTAAVNYVGSIFFGISAIASLTLPTTGETLNIALVNSATFAGAVCFLVGAYLLFPAASDTASPTAPARR